MQDEFEKYQLSGWFPGHMFKAGKQMSEALKLVDMAIELVDARAPFATRNPSLRQILNGKPFQIVANKSDLASPIANSAWEEYCAQNGLPIHFLDSRRTQNVKHLPALWRRIVMEDRASRGVTRPLLRPIRIIIAGVPNVGKSTLVNHLFEKNRAQVGPKPGVTRTNQWIPLENNVELLDTPGILWPRIKSKKHELLLALLGIFNEEVLSRELIADYLAWSLETLAIPINWKEFGLEKAPETGDELLNAIALRRGFRRTGNQLDTERAAISFIKDFRDKKLGRITLELPPLQSNPKS